MILKSGENTPERGPSGKASDTLHNRLILQLNREGWNVRGFRSALRPLMTAKFGEDLVPALFPDAWRICLDSMGGDLSFRVEVAEVSVTHVEDAVEKWFDLFNLLDFEGFRFWLLVVDRHGTRSYPCSDMAPRREG